MKLVLAGHTNVGTNFELIQFLTGPSCMEYFAVVTRRVASLITDGCVFSHEYIKFSVCLVIL
jgi:hypothetical protein